MENPFKYGEVVSGENFCNREKELKEIKRAIINGYSFWMYSPRRFGKSSLILKAFDELNENNITTIYFDMYKLETLDSFAREYSALLAKELFDWKIGIKKLTQKIGKYFQNLYPKISFDSYGNPSVSLEIKKIEDHTDIETILNIPDKIAEKSDIKICIAFDEFQEIQRIKPFLINWMRSLFQFQKKVSYIFLGSKQSLMEYIFTDINSPFYEFGFKMPIYPISNSDLTSYIKNRFRKTKLKINNNTISDILKRSRSHPHFTQYFAAVIWELILEGFDEKDPDFNTLWMKRIIDSQSFIFQNIYDQFNLNQRKTLIAISNLKDEKLFSGEYRKRFDLSETSSLTSTINSLIKKNLIQKVNGSYEIINPVFEEWVKIL